MTWQDFQLSIVFLKGVQNEDKFHGLFIFETCVLVIVKQIV